MAIQDLWYSDEDDPETGKRMRTKRNGRGKRWRVSWENPETRKIATRAFDRLEDAKTFDKNVSADITHGQFIDPKSGQKSVRECFEEWRSSQLFRASTSLRVASTARMHFLPAFGDAAIGSVRRTQIQRWVKDRSRVLAPSTLSVLYSTVVSPFFKSAEIDQIINRSPCIGITLPDIEQADYYIARPSEIHKLSKALPRRYRAVPYFVAGCGWRSGETFGAEESVFDFLRREASVLRQLDSTHRGKTPMLGPPKTKQSKRTNELPNIAIDQLAAHLQTFRSAPIEVLDRSDPRNEISRTARLMFTTETGKAVRAYTWTRIWQDAVTEAGLPRGYGLRDLRHYFATALIWRGANVKNVQMAMGHANPTITLNTYTGYWPGATDTTRRLIDDSFEQDDEAAGGMAAGS